jgi:hypothetical protein
MNSSVTQTPGWRSTSGDTFVKWFIISAAVIFIISGIAKVVSGFGPAGIFNTNDPVFRIPFRTLMFLIGGLEIVVAGLCLRFNQSSFRLPLISFVALNFILYRIILWKINWTGPCHCLGNLSDTLHLPPHVADRIASGLSIYLLTGACAAMLWQRAKNVPAGVPELAS